MSKCWVCKTLQKVVYALINIMKGQQCATLQERCPCEITSEPSALSTLTQYLTKLINKQNSELLVLKPQAKWEYLAAP